MLPRYDFRRSYEWNYERAPSWTASFPGQTQTPPAWPTNSTSSTWTFAGRGLTAPIGVAAGPLLNGRWLNYYAQLGFDYLTYKTVRNQARACYPQPNLQPVAIENLQQPGASVEAKTEMSGNWAISFGMPSRAPTDWQADIAETKRHLRKGAILSVSVVASPDDDDGIHEVSHDYATCAARAVAAGADVVELNLSCPNVTSSDGQLYLDASSASIVVQRTRDLVDDCPILIKVGYVPTEPVMASLVESVAPYIQGIVTVNCLSAFVSQSGQALFQGAARGIGGPAIRDAALRQVEMATRAVRREGVALAVVGCGGISRAADVERYLSAGAAMVQLATAVMTTPDIGLQLRRDANFETNTA